MLDSPVEEIKNRLDVVEVIGSYIKLNKAGVNYRAICPFHSEKGPSFFVSPVRQIWHCFGCGAGGDIFKFVMQIEGVEFGDALRILAKKAGIELRPISKELVTERERLYEILELACQFFEKQLESSKIGLEARKYLSHRGITEESIKKWRLGYSPDVWQGLSDFLVGKGYKREEVASAGLAIKREDAGRRINDFQQSSFYDRFRSRIMFPVTDMNNQVIGFGGRIFGDEKRPDGEKEAKYINTPSTLLYDKSRVLYGLDRAKMSIRKKEGCIVVEGYTDVIMSHQAGVENTVAVSGTALTPHQLKILKRYSENLLICFDMDIAGDSATKRGIDSAQMQGFNIKIISLPEEMDPADVISKEAKDWEGHIEKSKSIMDFYFNTTLSRYDRKTPEGKKAISKILLPVIKRIPNQIEKSYWVQELARKLEVREDDISAEMKKVKTEASEFQDEMPAKKTVEKTKNRKELLEEKICSLFFKFPERTNELTDEDLSIFSFPAAQVISYLKLNCAYLSNKNKADQIIEDSGRETSVPDAGEINELVNYLALKSEVENAGFSQDDINEDFRTCLKEIRLLGFKNRLDIISREIKKAEEERDIEKIQALVQEFSHCSKLLRSLETA